MREVYINKVAKFLPNKGISNEEIESFLGEINATKSKVKNLILRSNQIKNRYYALSKDGKSTHTNAEMTAESIRALFIKNPSKIKDVELLTAGTSSPDQLMPSHAVMTHGELSEMKSIEVMSPSGNCCSGVQGMKYAYLSIASGQTTNAVCTGSERLSPTMRAEQFEDEVQDLVKMKEDPFLAFDKEFLRWMLSDGAGSVFLSNKKNKEENSLKIDFIEIISYANEAETCMYMACEKDENGKILSYKDFSPEDVKNKSVLSIKQDTKLLSKNILKYGMDKLQDILEKYEINLDGFDYFLPHLSSYFFKEKIYELLKSNDLEIPYEKWFTNLSEVGNVGSASPFLMLEEIMNNDTLKKGDKLLMMVPESARFSYVYISLTVC